MDPSNIPALLIAAVGASPLVIAPIYILWETIKPHLISQAEIDRLAEDYMRKFGARAMDQIETLADRAQRRGETAELGCLIRISRAVARLEKTSSP